MGGQVVGVLVLLAAGCNQLTGVGDLKVVPESCTPADKETCSVPGPSSETDPLLPPGAAGSINGPEDGAAGSGDPGSGGATGDPGSSGSGGASPIEGLGGALGLVPPPGNGPGGGPGGGPDDGSGGMGAGTGSGAGASGASGDPADPPGNSSQCAPGSPQACTGEALCAGTQLCLPDGSAFGPCACPPPGNARAATVGAACSTDTDCAAGLFCTTEADVGGPFSAGTLDSGPQNGYCSRLCSSDGECQAVDPLALCLGPDGGPFYCFEGCEPLTASFPIQCNGRNDLTCIPLFDSAGRSYCAPACHSDAECAPRFCNLATGLCQDPRPPEVPIGSACSVNEDCNGVCLELRGQPLACTGICTFGSTGGCGDAEAANEHDAACLDTAFGNGLGFGVCLELCDEDADCEQQASGWGCTPWGLDVVLDYALRFNRLGFCELRPPGGGPGCNDDCFFASDGECDDGGPGAQPFVVCDLGTDCTDCGAR